MERKSDMYPFVYRSYLDYSRVVIYKILAKVSEAIL